MVNKTVTFTGYKKTDAYGNEYDNSITLEPFTSVVFVSSEALPEPPAPVIKPKAKYIFTKDKVRDTPPSVYNDAAAYYPLRGNANDLTGNAPGTVYGATATVDRFNLANKALSFDGVDDYVQSNAKFGQGDFTVSFWFKLDELPAVGVNRRFFTKYVTSSTYIGAHVQANSATNQSLLFENFIIGTNNVVGPWNQTNLISLGIWHHTVVTLNGDTARLYLNNVLIATKTGFTNRVTSQIDAMPLHLAKRSTSYMKTNLSDFAIWQRALSEAEITAIYNEKAVYKNKPLRGVDGKIITTLK
jgi:hypothetical protein